MFELFSERGEARRSYRDKNIIIICKQDEEGSRKAIFIPTATVFYLYAASYTLATEEVPYDILVMGSYNLVTVNTNHYELPLEGVSLPEYVRVDISRFLGGQSWLLLQSVDSDDFQLEGVPPAVQFRITPTGGVKEDINWGVTPDSIGTIWNGTDRDIAISPEKNGNWFGYAMPVSFYQRLWADPDFEFTLAAYIPILQTATIPPVDMAFGPLGYDESDFTKYYDVRGNLVYMNGWQDGTLGVNYSEFWALNLTPATPTFSWLYSFVGISISDSRDYWFNSYVKDPLGDKMGFTVSRRYDVAGNPDDQEDIHVAELGDTWYPMMDTPLFSFISGDLFGYSGRTAGQVGRDSKAWYIGDGTIPVDDGDDIEFTDMYAVAVSNYTEVPGGIIRRYKVLGVETFDVIYTVPTGLRMDRHVIDYLDPTYVMFNTQRRSDNGDIKWVLLNVVTGKEKNVSGAEGNRFFNNGEFVR